MARVIFARGVRGDLIKKMQRRLADLGFDPQGIDGVYGNDTAAAVKDFQTSRGIDATGEVDATTYKRLMGTNIPSVDDRSLQLTAAFEGHGFTIAAGNFDGAGITWGIIGFTLKHGELKKIILTINKNHPELVQQAFQNKTEELLNILQSPLSKQLAFADSISIGPSKKKLAEPWRSAFERFGEMEEVQALQLKLADRDFLQPAGLTAKKFNLKTELGFALAFDIHVQNGGVKKKAEDQIKKELAENPINNERELRIIIAHAVADHSKPEFRDDVRSRKLTIATGTGKVHGETFVVRNWGLDEFPV